MREATVTDRNLAARPAGRHAAAYTSGVINTIHGKAAAMTGRHAEMNFVGPALRKVVANILTEAGWVHGTFLVPAQQNLLDYFGGAGPLIKLTHVRWPGEVEQLPFIALRREVITLVDPTIEPDMVEAPGGIGRTTPHRVRCFLAGGQLHATLAVLVNVRLSDFLRQQTGLVVLRDCLFVPAGETTDSKQSRRMPVAILNLRHVHGVGEAPEHASSPGN